MGQDSAHLIEAWDQGSFHDGQYPEKDTDCQPVPDTENPYAGRVVTPSLKETIAANIRTILKVEEGHVGQGRLMQRGISSTNARRVLNLTEEESYRIMLLEEVAHALRVDPWVLCVPANPTKGQLEPEAAYALNLFRNTPEEHRAMALAMLENISRFPPGHTPPTAPTSEPPTPLQPPGPERLPGTRPARRRTRRNP
jgi:hypothetical protein